MKTSCWQSLFGSRGNMAWPQAYRTYLARPALVRLCCAQLDVVASWGLEGMAIRGKNYRTAGFATKVEEFEQCKGVNPDFPAAKS